MDDGRSRSLTRRQFDAVIRRAAELAEADPDGSEGALSEVELFRIAGEVGLPEGHVRRALAEVRSGQEHAGFLDRTFGPASITASRIVPGTPDGLRTIIDDFLVATQLLQTVRRSRDHLQYRPALDWASQLARAASFSSRKYYVASAKSVEVRLERVDDQSTLVELFVDPGTRSENVAGAVFGGGVAAGAVGMISGMLVAAAAPLALAVGAGVFAGAVVWTGIGSAVAVTHKKKVLEVRNEVEGVLDDLEVGRSLEPPPSSWRRWVKRNFHGVARDLTRHDDDE
ncbi:MAG: hypothetical protein OEN56_02425 [Gemmatimonadota bacterium]|nr:hypothetical protein [Gemmatimonadota bacterium]